MRNSEKIKIMYYKYICIIVQIVKIKKITNICHVHPPLPKINIDFTYA